MITAFYYKLTNALVEFDGVDNGGATFYSPLY